MEQKRYPYLPEQFSGSKFAKRYGLNPDTDFYADTNFIYLRDGLILPDDPPVFEPPTPWVNPNATLISKIDALIADSANTTLAIKVKDIMIEWRKKL